MKLALALSFSLSTLGGCMIGDPGSANDEDIIGGSIDSGDPSVVMVRYTGYDGSTGLCTASVIAPKLLLTAAHCSKGYNYQYTTSNSLDWTSASNSGWISASGVFANPSYDGDTRDGHDVAVITLASNAAVAPLALGAAPGVGATVRAIGYGMTQHTGGVSITGTKMTKSGAVVAATAREFSVAADFTCHGDSGGPVLDASGAIVGTTSYGDTADCYGTDHFSRVDDNRAWIDSMISTFGGGASSGGGGGGGGTGGGSTSTCSTQISTNGLTKKVSCSNGTCQCYLNGAQLSTCTATASGCSIPGNCCGF